MLERLPKIAGLFAVGLLVRLALAEIIGNLASPVLLLGGGAYYLWESKQKQEAQSKRDALRKRVEADRAAALGVGAPGSQSRRIKRSSERSGRSLAFERKLSSTSSSLGARRLLAGDMDHHNGRQILSDPRDPKCQNVGACRTPSESGSNSDANDWWSTHKPGMKLDSATIAGLYGPGNRDVTCITRQKKLEKKTTAPVSINPKHGNVARKVYTGRMKRSAPVKTLRNRKLSQTPPCATVAS